MDGAIGAHGQTVANVRLGISRADAGNHDVGGDAFLAQAQGFLQGDVVKRVGRQLDAIGDHAGAVRLDLDAHVEINDAFVTDQDFHRG